MVFTYDLTNPEGFPTSFTYKFREEANGDVDEYKFLLGDDDPMAPLLIHDGNNLKEERNGPVDRQLAYLNCFF